MRWVSTAAIWLGLLGGCGCSEKGQSEVADVLDEAAEPDGTIEPCRLSAVGGPSTVVVAALRVCESPMSCGKGEGTSPFCIRAAYLYADGRLLSRDGTTWSPGVWFREQHLSAQQLCAIAAGVSLDGLARQRAELQHALDTAEAKLRRAEAAPRLAAEKAARETVHATIDLKAMHGDKTQVLWTLNGQWLDVIRWNKKSVTVRMAGEPDTIPHTQVGGAR